MFLYLSQSLAIIVMGRLVTASGVREKITDRGWIVTATGLDEDQCTDGTVAQSIKECVELLAAALIV
jgi:hypothetical protein